MTSLYKIFWQNFFVQDNLLGTGGGLLFLPSVVIVSTYFPQKRSFAAAIASLGSSIGASLILPPYFMVDSTDSVICQEPWLIYSIVFSRLEARIDFRWTICVIVFIMMTKLLVTVIAVRPQRGSVSESRRISDIASFSDSPFIWFYLSMCFGFTGMHMFSFYVEL